MLMPYVTENKDYCVLLFILTKEKLQGEDTKIITKINRHRKHENLIMKFFQIPRWGCSSMRMAAWGIVLATLKNEAH